MRRMSLAIMPFHRAIPKNDARYSQIWDRDKSTTTLRLTKIDEIILKQSFRAVANVDPIRLTTTTGTDHLLRRGIETGKSFLLSSGATLSRKWDVNLTIFQKSGLEITVGHRTMPEENNRVSD